MLFSLFVIGKEYLNFTVFVEQVLYTFSPYHLNFILHSN